MNMLSNNTSLLIIDDDPPVASSLRRLFSRSGFSVRVAGCGKEGLAALDEMTPLGVISDYRMPDVSGIDVLMEVQRRYPKTLCVLISGYADSGALQTSIKKLQKSDHFFFVPKPWDDDRFVSQVKAALHWQETEK